MRNTLRAGRDCRQSRLQLEQLEPRQLLSVALAGTMLSSFQQLGGTAQFSLDNAQANLQTRISVQFERDLDSSQSSPTDHLGLSIDFYTITNPTWLGTLSTNSIGTNYAVTTSSAASSFRLTGNFDVDGSAFGVTFQHASLALNVAWTRTSIDQHVETVGLELGDGERTLTVSLQDIGKASAAGIFNWMQGSAQVQATLPIPPVTLNATAANVYSTYQQTNDLPDGLSLKTLIQELSPPDLAPKNSKVSVHSTQAATTGLVVSSGDPNSGIRVAQGQDYFDNAQVIPPTGFVAFSANEGDFGGFVSTGMSVSTDATSADAKGGANGFMIDSFGNVNIVPFNLDLHWQADPTSAFLTFIRTTTTTATSITTEFAQQTDYDALVTGTTFFSMSGIQPTFIANGELSQFRSVTITSPLPVKGQIVTLPDATVISKTDWQNFVVKPWQSSINLASDNGFLNGKGKGKNLVIQLRKAVRSHFSFMPPSRGLN